MAFSDRETKAAFGSAFKTFPVLQTQRLILSEILGEEAETYFRQQRSALEMPNRPPWSFGLETQSVAAAHSAIHFANKAWQKKASLRFGVRLKAEAAGTMTERPVLIGLCALFDFQNQYKAEMGYWLGAAYHNRGIMTEAVQAVVAFAFGTMRMNRIYAYTAVENAPSIAMLKKVGFVQEGVLRQNSWRDGKWGDTALLAILASDLAVSEAVAE